jgi:hypothetical protein
VKRSFKTSTVGYSRQTGERETNATCGTDTRVSFTVSPDTGWAEPLGISVNTRGVTSHGRAPRANDGGHLQPG